jgi:hypothetical protein
MPDDSDSNVWSAPELSELVPNSMQKTQVLKALQILKSCGLLRQNPPRGSGHSTYRAMLAREILCEKYPLYKVVPIVRDNEH